MKNKRLTKRDFGLRAGDYKSGMRSFLRFAAIFGGFTAVSYAISQSILDGAGTVSLSIKKGAAAPLPVLSHPASFISYIQRNTVRAEKDIGSWWLF